MGIFSWAVGKMRDLFGLNKGIQDAFGVTIAVSKQMLTLQRDWRLIVAGEADWNNADTPSLHLADAVSSRIASRVALGLKCEISGSARADYINEQIKPVITDLQYTVQSICNDGEVIFKPYIGRDKLETTLVETDCYWPIGYNTNGELVDVIFGAVHRADKTIYRLLERHTFNIDNKSHSIEYKVYKTEQTAQGFTHENLGTPASLQDVPDWAQLQDITILGIEKPLFVVIKAPPTKKYEKPQLQGVPIWAKAIDQFKKADRQEARTEFEFEGGELAIHADDSMFKRNEIGQLILPKGKERVYRGVHSGGADTVDPIDVFNPDPRIEGYDKRMNGILRRVEFLCRLSYGIISDNNLVEKTAEEFRSSKDELVTTVGGIQLDTMQPALEHLIESYNVLADIQGFPQGNCETKFEWSESYAIDRREEVRERADLTQKGLYYVDEFRSYYNEVSLEDAQKDLMERGIPFSPLAGEF